MKEMRAGVVPIRIRATPAALSRSAATMVALRLYRSARTPAHGPTSRTGTVSRTSVRLMAMVDPVSRNAWTGAATTRSHDPRPEIVLPAHRRRKFLSRRTPRLMAEYSIFTEQDVAIYVLWRQMNLAGGCA